MIARVKVSRPGPDNHRSILVDGRIVGYIYPDTSGCSSPGGRGRHSRLHGWYVVATHPAAVSRKLYGREHNWQHPDVRPNIPKQEILGRALRLSDAISWAQGYDWPITRYVASSGSQGGYMPDYAACCDSRDLAVEDLCFLHEVSPRGRMARDIRAHGYSSRVPVSSGYGDGRGTSLGGVVEVSPCLCGRCLMATVGEDMGDCEECQQG